MQKAFSQAASQAMNLNHQVIDIDDLLYACLEDSSGIFYRILMKLNISINDEEII